MRSKTVALCIMMTGILWLCGFSLVHAGDYASRFVKNFPPGYHGMWYYADRFSYDENSVDKLQEKYRWDKFMSKTTNMAYPFYPVPHAWDYGTTEKFNLPDYNTNDWP